MAAGRIVSSVAATAAVAGCALLVVGMTRASADQAGRASAHHSGHRAAGPLPAIPAQLPAHTSAPARSVAARTAAVPSHSAVATHAASSTSPVTHHAAPPHSATSTRGAAPTHSASRSAAPTHAATSTAPTHKATAAKPRHSAPPRSTPTVHSTSPAKHPAHSQAQHQPSGRRLPLHFATHHAKRVITVVASSHASTTARLQAWHKVAPHRWRKTGSAVTANVGSQGLTTSPSESKSATPIGSFGLTRAFGRLSNPGTKLHYFQTTPADWWISQSGSLYNTHQRCSSGCSFTQGDPNEHLYYETPYYNYAVVIEYNTHHVRQGAGSAFFLHVSVGKPTAGCVSIKQSKLVALMRWLKPHAHPRILIGVS